MNKEELLAQIGEWRNNREHQKVIDTLNALPAEEKDYIIIYNLAREYNIVGRFEEAKAAFESVKEEGFKDPNWHFHYGYTLTNLNEFEGARMAFQIVLNMAPKSKDALMMLYNLDVKQEKHAVLQAFGDGMELDEDKALEYILKLHLHHNFAAPDKIVDDHIEIPAWNISIYPEIDELKADSVIVKFNIESPDWDRDLIEISAAKGQNPKQALNVACSSFMLSLMHSVSIMAKNENAVRMETEFVGNKHSWNVYRGNILAGGAAQNIGGFNLYWDALKDELAKRVGNQKIAYVKVYAMKNGDQIKGECRINDVRIESLSRIVAQIASEWNCEGYGVQRQFFIFKQDEETTIPYNFSEEDLEEFTKDAMRIYHNVKSKEDFENLLDKMMELTNGDETLARELMLYVPMISAENAFRKLAYPETITFDYGNDKKVTVYRSQLAAFHSVAKALFWALQYKVFGDETDVMYKELITASPLYHYVQQSAASGNPVQDGMGVSLTINVDDNFIIR